MVEPDFKWLDKIYGRLGNYLHRQIEQYDDKEKLEFIDFIKKTLSDIKKYVYPRFTITDLTKNAEHIFKEYLADKINKEEMQRMVIIATIPRHMQNE